MSDEENFKSDIQLRVPIFHSYLRYALLRTLLKYRLTAGDKQSDLKSGKIENFKNGCSTEGNCTCRHPEKFPGSIPLKESIMKEDSEKMRSSFFDNAPTSVQDFLEFMKSSPGFSENEMDQKKLKDVILKETDSKNMLTLDEDRFSKIMSANLSAGMKLFLLTLALEKQKSKY